MQLVIITGASRGLGRELALQSFAPGTTVLTLERRPDPSLRDEATCRGAALEQWTLDLQHGASAAARLEAWLHAQDPARFATATLVNNAAALGSVGPIERESAADLERVLRVGLEAPMQLAAAFLRATAGWNGARRVLNISSGAGRRPIAGWAAYCAVKAGMDHWSRVTALDEAARPSGAKIVSLAPGVIDTAMQAHLRASDASGFPDKARFVELHASGQLASPQEAARRVLAYLARPDFGAEPVADVRA